MKLKSLFLLLALLWTFQASAIKGCPAPFAYIQPDGTEIHISIVGDENSSYKLSASGYLVAQGDDGFYYYVSHNSGGYTFSDIVVTDAGIGISKSIPSFQVDNKNFYSDGLSFDSGSLVPTKSGTMMKSIVIPVQFQDISFSFPDIYSKVYNLFNQLNYSYDGATGSVTDYFKDNLGTFGEFLFDIAPVVTLPQPVAYYGANNGYGADANIREMVKDACRLANQYNIDFSRYDINGDGLVDNVILFFAGHNEAEGGGDNTIWPQSWNLNENFSLNGVRISGFSCCSELSGSKGKQFTGIGTICHEYCHFLGFLDMYDVNGAVDGTSIGLHGTTSVMDYGNYNNDGKTPPYFNSIERACVNLLHFEEPAVDTKVDIAPVYECSRSYRLSTNTKDEFFVMEYRDGSKWDKYIGGDGILVYHIDKSSTMVGSATALSKWTSNSVNSSGSHPCVSLLSTGGTSGADAGDCFFPGKKGVKSILSSISFPLKAWNGVGVAKGIVDIEPSNIGYSFRIVKDESWELPVISEYMVQPTQTAAKLSWTADKQYNSGNWVLIWGATSSLDQDTLFVNGNSYQFESLEPGNNYSGKLYFQQGKIIGKPQLFSFKTIARTSNFPLIGFVDRQYSVGETLTLVVLNIIEETESINWSINDAMVTEGSYKFKESGTYIITAEVKYTDGSVELLRKRLIVQ